MLFKVLPHGRVMQYRATNLEPWNLQSQRVSQMRTREPVMDEVAWGHIIQIGQVPSVSKIIRCVIV